MNDTATRNRAAGVGTRAEVHLCDNYPNLLIAAADIAGRVEPVDATIAFIDDRLPLHESTRTALGGATGATVIRLSDDAAASSFARLPGWLPGMARRNLSWAGGRLVGPHRWAPSMLADRRFDVGYVYNPGFFLSKVVRGMSDRVVMRDSGYANYVRHRVPIARSLPRLLARRHPIWQTWGEEPWIDAIEVVRPDQVPERVRHKASRVTLDGFLERLTAEAACGLVRVFWGQEPVPEFPGRTALLISQPIDQLSMCSTDDKLALYDGLATRLRRDGYEVVLKPHPLEATPPVPDAPTMPRAFPIEGWVWLDRRPFDLAVSLNSAALADDHPSFADERWQLVPPEKFYAEYWDRWPAMIEAAFAKRSQGATPREMGE